MLKNALIDATCLALDPPPLEKFSGSVPDVYVDLHNRVVDKGVHSMLAYTGNPPPPLQKNQLDFST